MGERRAPVLLPRTKSIKAVVAKQYQAVAKTYPSLPTTIQSSEDATELAVANLIEADIVQLQRDESQLRGLEVELRRRSSLASQRIQLHADVDALKKTNHHLAAILAAMQTAHDRAMQQVVQDSRSFELKYCTCATIADVDVVVQRRCQALNQQLDKTDIRSPAAIAPDAIDAVRRLLVAHIPLRLKTLPSADGWLIQRRFQCDSTTLAREISTAMMFLSAHDLPLVLHWHLRRAVVIRLGARQKHNPLRSADIQNAIQRCSDLIPSTLTTSNSRAKFPLGNRPFHHGLLVGYLE
ncbi:hypothetical protein H257_09328 [Aphanomyces astaci]|uniref:Uncharacterized protein n=1 Tax=Aphanomyces astaci TaxID=112090 RepID=W4GB40_APHAT|nr:hypothetical protein H257_09328 [Aphanomyces astaci]ETV76890.1 hypothetical protein H257_09328 [Aphanomyces astaci]|eukprot:XP_009833802.1 hypothetical protein H257_09328 [Aphanomyces astaci]